MSEIARNYEDALFRLVIHEAVKKKSRGYMEEAAAADVAVLESADQQARKLIGRKLRRMHFNHAGRGSLRFLGRTLLLIAVVFTLTFGITMSVDALRADFTRFLLTFYPEYTQVELDHGGSIVHGGQSIEIVNQYIPTLIPEGFEIRSIRMSNGEIDLYYENAEGQFISFVSFSGAAVVQIDTEDAEFLRTVEISGNPGLFSRKDGTTTVTWSENEFYFVLLSSLDGEAVLDIAESVVWIDEK